MIGFKIDALTGEQVQTTIIAYKDASDHVIFLHDDESPPQGYTAITDEEAVALTSPTVEKIVTKLEASVQEYIDSVANAKGYDSASSCISYINSTNNTWKAEATAMNAWRDAVWMYCANLVQTLQAAPTKEELIAELPAAPW